MQPNDFWNYMQIENCTPDPLKLKGQLNTRTLVGFPSSFDHTELDTNQGENPLDHSLFHGYGRTSSSSFSCRNGVYFNNETSIFEIQGGKTKDGYSIPANNLGSVEVKVFSVPFRCMTYIDDVMLNTWTHNRYEFHVNLYGEAHEIHNPKVWLYIHDQGEIPNKYPKFLDMPEADFNRTVGRIQRKTYK
jgi:hypothetical protein